MSTSNFTAGTWYASKPTKPKQGDVYFNEHLGKKMGYSGGRWYELITNDEAKQLKIIENRNKKIDNLIEKDTQ